MGNGLHIEDDERCKYQHHKLKPNDAGGLYWAMTIRQSASKPMTFRQLAHTKKPGTKQNDAPTKTKSNERDTYVPFRVSW